MERKADKDQTKTDKPSPAVADSGEQSDELGEQELNKVAGGVLGNDDDLDDLEVERLRRR